MKNLRGLFCGVTVAIAIALPGCGKSNKPLTTSGASGANDEGVNAVNYVGSTCSNPIRLHDSTQPTITKKADFPKGKFELRGVRVYVFSQATKDSFVASATKAKQFEVNVDCDGVASARASFNVNFQAAEEMDTMSFSQSHTHRKLALQFEDGNLVSGITTLTASPSSSLSSVEQKQEEMDESRVSIGEDTFETVKFFEPSATQIEMRVKFEYPADHNGKRIIAFAEASYERSPSLE
jgi:hypothetical protein